MNDEIECRWMMCASNESLSESHSLKARCSVNISPSIMCINTAFLSALSFHLPPLLPPPLRCLLKKAAHISTVCYGFCRLPTFRSCGSEGAVDFQFKLPWQISTRGSQAERKRFETSFLLLLLYDFNLLRKTIHGIGKKAREILTAIPEFQNYCCRTRLVCQIWY